jgi:hypothetical protein
MKQEGITLTFSNLSPEQARLLLDTYSEVETEEADYGASTQGKSAAVVESLAPQSGMLDAKGVPYNPKIHAPLDGPSAGKMANGEWKCKRSASREEFEAWKLKHTQAPAPQAFPQAQAPQAFLQAQAPVPAPANPFAGSAPVEVTEAAVMAKAQELGRRGLMTAQVVQDIMAKAGTTDNVQLVRDPAMRQVAWVEMVRIEAEATS